MWKKIIIDYKPFSQHDYKKLWVYHGIWPARWLVASAEHEHIPVSAFRCRFKTDKADKIILHVTADSQYRLYCDGELVATGPEQGDCQNYFFDSYEWNCSSGEHILVALVFNGGDNGAYSRMGKASGFLLAAEGDAGNNLNTNSSNWDARIVPGIEFNLAHECNSAVGNGVTIDRSRLPVGLERGSGNWDTPREKEPGANACGRNEYSWGHLLKPASLLPQMNQLINSMKIVYIGNDDSAFYSESENQIEEIMIYEGGKLKFPQHCTRKVLFKLDNYYCANIKLNTSGGKDSSLKIKWTEALKLNNQSKGNREEFINRSFCGIGDCFIPSGEENEEFYTVNYRAGRYVELKVETAAAPLTINSFELRESRYPLQVSANFNCSNNQYNSFFILAQRTLEMCMHDTYMDCPFYEQLMYLGDARLQMLVNYNLSSDVRLAEKSLKLMASSVLPNGFLPSRYPCRVTQIIPPFSLFFPAMVCDYVKYRNSADVSAEIVPVARRVLDNFERYVTSENLLKIPLGWGFVDWVPNWSSNIRMGTPKNAEFGVSGVINSLYLYSLGQASELHELLGETELASRYKRMGKKLAEHLFVSFFSPEFNMLSDCMTHDEFSEHCQCLALLSNLLSSEQEEFLYKGLFSAFPERERTTFYFDFYYLEACRKARRMDLFHNRLSERFQSLDKLGLKTLLEQPEPSRSDCHAWSSHIIYHYFASILGVRPVAAGFEQVEIIPQLENFQFASGTIPTPQGKIAVDWQATKKESPLTINIPSNIIRKGLL